MGAWSGVTRLKIKIFHEIPESAVSGSRIFENRRFLISATIFKLNRVRCIPPRVSARGKYRIFSGGGVNSSSSAHRRRPPLPPNPIADRRRSSETCGGGNRVGGCDISPKKCTRHAFQPLRSLFRDVDHSTSKECSRQRNLNYFRVCPAPDLG